VEEKYLRALIREQLMDSRPAHRSSRLVREVLRSEDLRIVILEHETDMLMLEAGMTVGDLLASFDETVSDMDDSMANFIKEALEFAEEYAPENISAMIKKSKEAAELASSNKDDVKEMLEWFTDLKKYGVDLQSAWREAKKKYDDIKKSLQWLWGNKKEQITDVLDHFKGLKDLYTSNETFKGLVDTVFTSALKQAIKKLVEQAVKLIPYGDKLVAGYQMIKKAVEVGGKIKSLFASFRKSQQSPDEKFADFAEKIAKGPDNDQLGKFGKALQLNDDLEDVLDDKLEAEYIKWYVGELRKIAKDSPDKSIADININKIITDWIKKKYDRADADVGVDASVLA